MMQQPNGWYCYNEKVRYICRFSWIICCYQIIYGIANTMTQNQWPKIRVAIVGNAEPYLDYSSQIDDSDVVIRFNRTPHIETGLVGRKSSIHVFVNAEPVAREIARSKISSLALAAHTIWWSSNNRSMAKLLVNAHQLHNKKRVNYPGHIFNDLISLMTPRSDGRWITPSSGIKTIYRCLRLYPLSDISLYCFTWEGTYSHPWEIERQLCCEWCSEGRLRIV